MKFVRIFVNIFYYFNFREQLNRSLEIRENIEKKIKKAKATTITGPINR